MEAGNVTAEDVVIMLERAGFETGVDLEQMIDSAMCWRACPASPISAYESDLSPRQSGDRASGLEGPSVRMRPDEGPISDLER